MVGTPKPSLENDGEHWQYCTIIGMYSGACPRRKTMDGKLKTKT